MQGRCGLGKPASILEPLARRDPRGAHAARTINPAANINFECVCMITSVTPALAPRRCQRKRPNPPAR